MRRIIAYLFLLLHFNTGIFLPEAGEVDVYDTHGQLADDINSALEYSVQEVFGYDDPYPEDEDDDQPGFYQQIDDIQYCILSAPVHIENHAAIAAAARIYPEGLVQAPVSIPYEIVSPPPDAA